VPELNLSVLLLALLALLAFLSHSDQSAAEELNRILQR